jgi:hypothetical protein
MAIYCYTRSTKLRCSVLKVVEAGVGSKINVAIAQQRNLDGINWL